MRLFFSTFLLIPFFQFGQVDRGYEVGLEIGKLSSSNLGAQFDIALKFLTVEDDELAYGVLFRNKFFRSKDVFLGVQGSRNFIGFGGFLHYRLIEWFYIGAELEYNQNFNTILQPQKKWNLAGFVGGGIHRKLGESNFHLNAGLMFDVIDAIRDPLTTNPSNFSEYYFLRRTNPQNPQAGGQYVPLIYRITFLYRIPI
jgi:hypothetical protein